MLVFSINSQITKMRPKLEKKVKVTTSLFCSFFYPNKIIPLLLPSKCCYRLLSFFFLRLLLFLLFPVVSSLTPAWRKERKKNKKQCCCCVLLVYCCCCLFSFLLLFCVSKCGIKLLLLLRFTCYANAGYFLMYYWYT